MSGPPGPQWTNLPHGPAHGAGGGESPAALDATLRALREERGRATAGIGEQLFRMVMSGQLRDPAAIAVCRPLYDLDQQIFRVEAALRTYGSQPPAPGRQPWESGPSIAPAPPPHPSASRQPTRMCAHCRTPIRASDARCPVCGHPTADSLPLAAATPAADAAPGQPCTKCGNALRASDRFCPVCGTPRPA